MWPYEGRLLDYIEASGTVYAKSLEHRDSGAPQFLRIEAGFQPAFGSHVQARGHADAAHPRSRPSAGAAHHRHPGRDARARHLDARCARAAATGGRASCCGRRLWSPYPARGRSRDAVRPRGARGRRAQGRTSSRRAFRGGWMPMLAEGDDARLLWYMNHAHGSGPVVQRRHDHRRARRRRLGAPSAAHPAPATCASGRARSTPTATT